jgi:uncharacterized membrane protein YgcG
MTYRPSWTIFPASLLLLAIPFARLAVRAAQAAPSDYIEDEAGVIGPETRAAAFRHPQGAGKAETLAQVVVLTVKTTRRDTIEQYAWKGPRRGSRPQGEGRRHAPCGGVLDRK